MMPGASLRALDDVGGAFLEGPKAPEDEDFFKRTMYRTMYRFAGVFAQEAGSVLPPIALDPGNEVPQMNIFRTGALNLAAASRAARTYTSCHWPSGPLQARPVIVAGLPST